MIYEVINPSDPVTIAADDLEVAQATCLLLGRGQYGLSTKDGEEAMPILLFDGQFETWAKDTNFDLASTLKSRRGQIVECLRSAMCCGPQDRVAIAAAVGDDKDALARYNDAKRSSLNDICGRAADLADHGLRPVQKAPAP